MAVPKKTKNRTTTHQAVPLLGVYPKEFKAGSQRGICSPMVIAAKHGSDSSAY